MTRSAPAALAAAVAVCLPVAAGAGGKAGAAPPPVDVGFVICQAARAQEAIERRWREFEYVKEDVTEKREDGKPTLRSSVTTYVHRTRPDGIAVNEHTGRDGAPLPPEEAAREREATTERFRRLREDPREYAASYVKARKASDEKASTMSVMSAAFDLRYEGFDWIGDEPCWVVSFYPKPNFHPATKAQETFQKMAGVAWVRARDPLFLRLEADFIDNASAKFGPFATITRGSHLKLEQGDAVAGAPLAYVVDLDLYLRLFFVVRRNEHSINFYREFKRANPAPARTFLP